MRFEVLDLLDLPKRDLAPPDITLFLGIFYHLPDPLLGLKIAADATKELIILETSTRTGLEDGALFLEREGKKPEQVLSGIYGLSWRPTGPRVMEDIFRWLGFEAMRVVRNLPTPFRGADRGRMRVLAARHEDTLAAYDQAVESGRFVPG
jgi:tRNA (mo5U34)-methyltransferase